MRHHPELLFAHWAVPALKNLRGSHWQALVTQIATLPETHPNALAFALVMIDLNGCLRCDAEWYRERGGCAECACAVLKAASHVDEGSLIARFHAAQKRVAESRETPGPVE